MGSFNGAQGIAPLVPGFVRFLGGVWLWMFMASAWAERPFAFEHDTFAFANETVLEYHNGRASYRRADSSAKGKRFTQHCFVMSRSVVQFRKFARFDPNLAPLDDRELAERIRRITRRSAWGPALPKQDRVLVPGYANLRALSRARTEIVENNIGLGWTTYFRPGNWRIMLPHGSEQQARTHQELQRALTHGEFFIAYLTTFPESLSINHGVLVYEKKASSAGRNSADRLCYSVYDPNHATTPRTLEWSKRDRCFLYQRDWDFVGGRVVVWQVYGRPLQ